MKYLFWLLVAPSVYLFGSGANNENTFLVYNHTLQADTPADNDKQFNEAVDLFEAFSNRRQQKVNMKMGEKAYVQHVYYKEFRNNNTEVKYDLTIQFEESVLRVTANAYEYLLFNKRRTKFKIIRPEDLKASAGDKRIIECNNFIKSEGEALYGKLLEQLYVAE
jgi:hypothetical protein